MCVCEKVSNSSKGWFHISLVTLSPELVYTGLDSKPLERAHDVEFG